MAAATYLYCVIKAALKPSLTGVPPGLAGGTPPQLLQGSPGLWLVASQVPLDIYGPGKLESALTDINWVGRTAMAHEAVVEFFASRQGITVVPMKLFTMFSTPDRALADVADRRRTIEATVRQIAGAEEWGIRVLRTPSDSATAGRPALAHSGAAYLEAKKQQRDDAQQTRLAAAEAAVGAFQRLSSLAKASKRRDDTPPAGVTPPLLDAAFLVPLSRRDRFRNAAHREAEACARAGAQLTLTGPWPAYNFIQVDDRR